MDVLYHDIKTRHAYDFPFCFPHELIMIWELYIKLRLWSLYEDIRIASRGLFLKPFDKLAARVLSGPKSLAGFALVVLNLIKRCCPFIKLYLRNGSLFGMLHPVMDARRKLKEHEKTKAQELVEATSYSIFEKSWKLSVSEGNQTRQPKLKLHFIRLKTRWSHFTFWLMDAA